MTKHRLLLLIIPAVIVGAMACTDYDADIKRIIAAYYDVDVSKVSDRPILVACGRMAIESGWEVDPKWTNKYRFMFVSSAEGEAHRVAAQAIVAVTGDDAPSYCEGKLGHAYDTTPQPTPTPKWQTYSSSASTQGSVPTGIRSPDTWHPPAELSIGCYDYGPQLILAFGTSNDGPHFIVDQARYSLDGAAFEAVPTEETGPDVWVRVEQPEAFARRLAQATELVLTAPRHNGNDEPGPELRSVFDLTGMSDALREVSCITY